MTDTAGASDVVFGPFWLLGYQFSPRLADIWWRPVLGRLVDENLKDKAAPGLRFS